MVPRIGTQGSSFKGAALYYLHDKAADTDTRVEFTQTRNLPTDDPEMAWRWMARTALDSDRLKLESGSDRRGRKSTKPVFTFSLSWHPDETPEQEHMVGTMERVLDRLGLDRHQVLIVSHNDEPQPHIHAVVNLVHPETGRTAPLKFSKEKLSKWAEEYEREHGIYCQRRIENNAKREHAKKHGLKKQFPRHKEPELDLKAEITRRYFGADSGKAFRTSMRELGFELAQGRRIVLVDRDGIQHGLARQIAGGKAPALRAKLADIELPPFDDVRREVRQQGEREKAPAPRAEKKRRRENQSRQPERDEPVFVDRDQQDRDWQEGVIDAGIQHQKDELRTGLLNRLQDAHLNRWGMFYAGGHHQRERLAATLDGQYGAHEKELRRAIEEREKTIRESSAVKTWVLKNFTRETNRLENDRRTLASIEQRKTEARGALEMRLEAQRAAMEQRHARERQAVPRDFTPGRLDPLARSIEQQQREAAPGSEPEDASPSAAEDVLAVSIRRQQAEAGRAFLGAAAPVDTPSAQASASASADDYASRRAAYMERAAAAREELEQGSGPAPGEGEG